MPTYVAPPRLSENLLSREGKKKGVFVAREEDQGECTREILLRLSAGGEGE